MIDTTVIGSYPVRLSGARHAKAYFEGAPNEAPSESLRQALQAQIKAKVDIVSDGQTSGDFVNIFARNFSGLVIQTRPVVLSDIEYLRPSTANDQKAAKELLPAGVRLKGIITGPYTMAKSSINRHYKSLKELSFAYAEGLAKEAQALDDIVDFIQIDEPFFSVDYPDYGGELVAKVLAQTKSQSMLHICGDVSRIFERLVEYNVDYLEHEFAANPRLWDIVKEIDFKQRLGVGVVRSDVNRAETIQQIESRMRTALNHKDEGQLMFNPDCGLRNLDIEVAQAKLRNMVLARDRL
jgi:5-methyltetrahydropteroyltriglutamate--homocysteine methyltransferase